MPTRWPSLAVAAAVDGKAPACAPCGTVIVDTATLRRHGEPQALPNLPSPTRPTSDSGGVVFCCSNCLAGGARGGSLPCTHCGTAIVDVSSEAEVDQRIFCCPDCAQVHAGMGLARSGRSAR